MVQPRPASLLQQFDQPARRRHSGERQRVHQLDERQLDIDVVDIVLAPLVGHTREVGSQLVGQLDQPRVVIGSVKSLAQGEGEVDQPQRDPAITLGLNDPLVDPERPHPVEILDHFRGAGPGCPQRRAGRFALGAAASPGSPASYLR
ncbi:hypothetical protein [Nonomuraea longispora]|uniref:hypothetical protein n=1 Tax=Nonomuraea longispora TaxID=1848320 RepID=UPI001FE616D1|nr:hypothetical protein [Nonomuraea longispora]